MRSWTVLLTILLAVGQRLKTVVKIHSCLVDKKDGADTKAIITISKTKPDRTNITKTGLTQKYKKMSKSVRPPPKIK